MATEKINIVVDADDNASSKLNNVKSTLSNLYGGISSINTALRQYNSAMSTYNRMVINAIQEVGSAIYDFTSDSISNFSELSEQHAKTLGAMANDYDKTLESQQKFMENSEKLKQQAIDLAKYGINGQGSLATSVEVSAVQTELIKAGVKADTMLSTNIVSDVLQFAQANQLDTASAVEFAVSLGNQFGVGYEDWGDMLDKVSHTADMSIIEVSEIVQSMKYAGGISSGIDRPMEEVLGMISVLGNFGLRGSQAGSGIQAFLTRLLTGDTTVITDAMAEVAPEKALKSFYDFSNYAKSGGSEITYEDILNETFTENDITGQLRPMDEVLDALETTMSDLNDEEQAWFAKKLFGLYQMKSAYALINGDESGEASLDEVIKEIEENSTGTNANKLAELVNSQSGQMEATMNLIDGIKTELGQMLEPTTLAVLHEVQEFLKDPGNYDINWNSIRGALDESCDAIEQAYGSAIADAVRNLGGLAIDLGEVVEEIAPEFIGGIGGVFNSILEGDIEGIGDNWGIMIENMDKALEDLPPDLKKLGEKVVDVIDMFGKLAALNIATTIAQLVTSVLQIAMMTINAASVIVNGSTITGGGTGTGTGTGTGSGKGSGNGSGKGSGNGSGGNTVITNGAGVVGAIGGAIVGDEVGDVTGQMASDIAEGLGADEGTASTVGGVVDTATTIGGAYAGSKLLKWIVGGGLKAAIGKLEWSSLLAAESGSMAGASSWLGPLGVIAGVSMLAITDYIENQERLRINGEAADITENGGDIQFDSNGKIITDSNGNVVDFNKLQENMNARREAEYDPYAYNNGHNQTMITSAPPTKDLSNLWGLLPAYGEKMDEYQSSLDEFNSWIETEKSRFYDIQSNYKMMTGEMLTWDEYNENKGKYIAQYTTPFGIGARELSLLSKGANLGIDPSMVPGWDKYLEALANGGKQSVSYGGSAFADVNANLNLSPAITVTPQIQVNVTIDKEGNITSQDTSILEQGFSKSMDTWFRRISLVNGKTLN